MRTGRCSPATGAVLGTRHAPFAARPCWVSVPDRRFVETIPAPIEHDLDGGTLLPGLIDAHNHFLSTGESLASLDLRYPGVDSAGPSSR